MFVTIRFRTYCHATEDEERVRQALSFVSGVGDKETKVTINRGYHGNEIRVLETTLKKGPRLTDFLERLVEAGIYDSIRPEIPTRLDDECVFYIRFDKQRAYQGSLAMDHGEDTIQMKAKVQVYPSRPDRAAEEIEAQFTKVKERLARKGGRGKGG